MIEALADEPRLIVAARLQPIAGATFQPANFPDLGAATYKHPDGSLRVLVDSVQSMANRLEDLGWDDSAQKPVRPIADLPYIRVQSEDGTYLASSRQEPHRLASAYVRDADIEGAPGNHFIENELGLEKEKPLDWQRIARGVFELDPLCLLHGVYFSTWYGSPGIRRAITALIEAHDAAPVPWGGVKRDDVSFSVDEASGPGTQQGYGFVPFAETDYAAREIKLTFIVDLKQIRGYGLEPQATRLLTLVALWEIAKFLAEPRRLRSRCDLEVISVETCRPDGFQLPSADDLADEIESVEVDFKQPGPRTAVLRAAARGRGAKKRER